MARKYGIWAFVISVIFSFSSRTEAKRMNPNSPANVAGFYFVVVKNPASAFANLKTITILGYDGSPPKGGWLELKNNSRVMFDKISLDGKKINFQTHLADGTSLLFSGEFTERFSVKTLREKSGKGDVILKGSLSKMSAGKEIEKADLGLSYWLGD